MFTPSTSSTTSVLRSILPITFLSEDDLDVSIGGAPCKVVEFPEGCNKGWSFVADQGFEPVHYKGKRLIVDLHRLVVSRSTEGVPLTQAMIDRQVALELLGIETKALLKTLALATEKDEIFSDKDMNFELLEKGIRELSKRGYTCATILTSYTSYTKLINDKAQVVNQSSTDDISGYRLSSLVRALPDGLLKPSNGKVATYFLAEGRDLGGAFITSELQVTSTDNTATAEETLGAYILPQGVVSIVTPF